jgi:hypothetical protein
MSRIAVCALMFAASGLLVCQRAGPVAAQNPKTANLEKQVAVLKQELQQAAQQNSALKNANAKLQAEVNRLQGVVKKDKKDSKSDDKSIKGLQGALDGYRNAGLVHVVILTLKAGSPSGEAQSVIDDTYSQLAKIKGVRGAWAGKPAAKGTPDAGADYTVALVLAFDGADGLKSYLNDSAHTKFVDKHMKKWEKPVVYDFEPKKPATP